ncbi:vesicle-trafficking protein SEC22b-like [Watersipora subatra]|uniref:vesicle-trafficking protein SEC22b-like n=1 Tax=Watersipora subatra TaxID=2589382 RepID=UPI00355C9BDB
MILITYIARVVDGLALAASIQEDENAGRSIQEYQNKAKQLCRKLSSQSPSRCSLEAGPYMFHYAIERNICFLTLCDKAFSKRQAYAYLEEIQNEFISQYGSKVDTQTRPYSFIEFDTFIQKTKKTYEDSRVRRNLSNINTELQDVQRIMVQNIDDVLQRGDALGVLDDKARDLSMQSQKYRKDARYLNLRSSYAKVGAICLVLVLFLLFLRYFIF